MPRRVLVFLCSFLVTASFIFVNVSPAAAAGGTTGFRSVALPASDGVELAGHVIAPAARGPHPGLVLISSWGLTDAAYLHQARSLAGRGYVVLSYTARGFWGSGGQIDTAGPKDIADVTSAIDWLLANTPTRPDRVGLAGVSYGGGISLIASAFDPRIKAVVVLSGWADLVTALYGDATRRVQAVGLLDGVSRVTGRPSAELRQVLSEYYNDRAVTGILEWGRTRSAATYLDSINRNRPAVMMVHSYGDSLFGVNHLVDFFGRLTGPKRLELGPGDHVVAEATGLVGLPNRVWATATRWLDQYLRGVDTGITAERPVLMYRLGTEAAESYPNWSGVTGSTTRLGLGPVRQVDGTGVLGGTPAGGWGRTIYSGIDTTADAGIALLTNGLTALTGIAPTTWLPLVNRAHAGVWVSDPFPAGAPLRGIPRTRLGISGGDRGTLVVYLYDTDAWGTGRLITHAPVTWLTPTSTLDLALPAVAHDLPAGHRLTLVVDTADPLYLGANRFGAPLRFTGPSWLDLPTR